MVNNRSVNGRSRSLAEWANSVRCRFQSDRQGFMRVLMGLGGIQVAGEDWLN